MKNLSPIDSSLLARACGSIIRYLGVIVAAAREFGRLKIVSLEVWTDARSGAYGAHGKSKQNHAVIR